MEKTIKTEKNRGRIEKRTTLVTEDIEWISNKKDWKELKSIGAIHTEFEEHDCRIEDKTIQQNLNMPRKLAINIIKQYKERSKSKRAISKIMFDCLLDPSFLCDVIF